MYKVFKRVKWIIGFNPYSIGFYSLMLTGMLRPQVYHLVSILILLDSILLSSIEAFEIYLLYEFQSLFYWILFSYLMNYSKIIKETLSFNPYSIGFYSLI